MAQINRYKRIALRTDSKECFFSNCPYTLKLNNCERLTLLLKRFDLRTCKLSRVTCIENVGSDRNHRRVKSTERYVELSVSEQLYFLVTLFRQLSNNIVLDQEVTKLTEYIGQFIIRRWSGFNTWATYESIRKLFIITNRI